MKWWFVKTILHNERGLSLAIVLMMMVVLLSITGAGLLFSNLNLKASANLKGGTVALQAADAGIQHALAAIPAGGDFDSFWTGTGLTNFPCKDSSGTTGTCNGTTYKPTLTGSINGYSYTVVVENDTTVVNETATNDINKTVIFTSTATSPSGSNERLRLISGDPRGPRRGLFIFQGKLQTWRRHSMAMLLRLAAMILIRMGPRGRPRRSWGSLQTMLARPQRLRVLEARSAAASMVRLPVKVAIPAWLRRRVPSM